VNSRRKHRTRGPQACAQLHSDDGIDPRDLFGEPSRRSRNKPDWKVFQLCGQVRRTLGAALPGDMADPLLQDLVVESVVPAPDASRLLVTVYRSTPGPMTDAEERDLLDRLDRVQGMLRREVAAAIVRKRAPELTFHVLRPGEVRA
jgi:ribosome-binding factor A